MAEKYTIAHSPHITLMNCRFTLVHDPSVLHWVLVAAWLRDQKLVQKSSSDSMK